MKKKLKIVAIIPARGGSKGVPRKNIRDLAGKPLIAYTIEAAKKSGYIDRIIVSTDDEEIAKIAREYGADVPFMRPIELATDTTPGVPVLKHAVHYMEDEEDYFPDIIVELMPTAPLRLPQDIDFAVEKLFNSDFDSVIGLTKVKEHPYWLVKLNRQGKIKPFIKNYETFTRRQDLPPLYVISGVVWAFKRSLLDKLKTHILCGKMSGIVIPRKRAINIDTVFDLKIAELMLRENKI